MNGYKMMADSYRKLINDGKINNDTAEKEILVYEFLSTCDINDCCRMLDIYAFNDIIRAFLKITVENADIDKKIARQGNKSAPFYIRRKNQQRKGCRMAKNKIELIEALGTVDTLTVQKSKPLFALWQSELTLAEFKM